MSADGRDAEDDPGAVPPSPADVLLEARGAEEVLPRQAGDAASAPSRTSRRSTASTSTSTAGETVGLVGESGCGKSTLGRTLLRLLEPTAGEIRFDGVDLVGLEGAALKEMRRHMQIVFQDSVGSLDPRMRSATSSARASRSTGSATAAQRTRQVVSRCSSASGSAAEAAERYPHQFSGGQRQRIGLARALVLQPKFIVADEPVSALDVSIQSQVLNLLVELKQEFDLTYLFVAHDLAVVGYISDRVAVMYLGKVVEIATVRRALPAPAAPVHAGAPLGQPRADPGPRAVTRIVLTGDVPSPINPPSGCRFRTRCPIAQQICSEVEPPLEDHGAGPPVACHFAGRRSCPRRRR